MRDFIAVGIVLLAATAAAAEIAPDSGLTGDLDGDGQVETAYLFDNPDGFTADLVIYRGDENTVFDSSLVVAQGEAIAAVGRAGDYVTLAWGEGESGFILNYGPLSARTTLRMDVLNGAWSVIGWGYYSEIDGATCSVDLTTGKGTMTYADRTVPVTTTGMQVLPIEDWKEAGVTIPTGCF